MCSWNLACYNVYQTLTDRSKVKISEILSRKTFSIISNTNKIQSFFFTAVIFLPNKV